MDIKNARELVEQGRTWYAKKIEEGYKRTCDGLLSSSDIKRGGYIWSEENQEYQIPGVQKNIDGKNVIVATEQYISFKQGLSARMNGLVSLEEKAEKLAQEGLAGFLVMNKEIIN